MFRRLLSSEKGAARWTSFVKKGGKKFVVEVKDTLFPTRGTGAWGDFEEQVTRVLGDAAKEGAEAWYVVGRISRDAERFLRARNVRVSRVRELLRK